MTPTLRELTYTAPYMHNGTIKPRSEDVVVVLQSAGGGDDLNMDSRIRPLGLSNKQERDQSRGFPESTVGRRP